MMLTPHHEVRQAGPGTFDGPRRYLEWSKPMDLYCQYLAFSDAAGETPASLSTFMKVFHKVFAHHLKFRDKAEFGQCDVCYKLRRNVAKASSKEAKMTAAQSYTKHLLSQWLDRQHYWNLRSLSRNCFSEQMQLCRKVLQSDLSSSVLTAIMDGMDQAKLRVPRHGYQRVTKTVEKVFRPALHLAATWLHGAKLHLSVTDEDVKKNSETQQEMLCRALCSLLGQCTSLPLGFHLQQDNCFREGKNQFVANFMIMLVCLGIFRWTSMGFLRTAHSHEDVDQAFGQIARLLIGKAIPSADGMVNLINEVTAYHQGASSSGSRIRGSDSEAYKLDEVSCWKAWGYQTGISMKGLRRVHYVRFCLRKDLGSDILNHVGTVEDFKRQQQERLPDDIFLVTKRWLADAEVARVVAIMPAMEAARLRRGFHPPGGLADRRPISSQVKSNIAKFIPKCRRSGELSPESCDYLLQWSSGALAKNPKPATYPILTYRWNPALRAEIHHSGTWNTPARKKRFDLTRERDNAGDLTDSSSESEGGVALPVGLDE